MQPAKIIHGQDWAATANGNKPRDVSQVSLQESLWSRVRSLFTWEDLTVAGREVKGWVVPQSLGVALIVVVLGAIGGIYWRMSDRIDSQNRLLYDQKELIIRLDQRLIDRNERDAEKREEMEKRLQNMDAVMIVLGRDIAKLQGKGRN